MLATDPQLDAMTNFGRAMMFQARTIRATRLLGSQWKAGTENQNECRNAAISARDPPRGCVHHSDRGSQYASEDRLHKALGLGIVVGVATPTHGASETVLSQDHAIASRASIERLMA
jgi:hypothetical protein